MIALAPEALADVRPEAKPGFTRFVRREPLGVVLDDRALELSAAHRGELGRARAARGQRGDPAPLAQTPLCAERFRDAFAAASLPDGVFSVLHCDHAATERLITSPGVDFVAFTGSVDAGRAVARAAAQRFLGSNLELGGKDPAYVRPDADLAFAVAELVDGAFFNAGQSCCGIERIYVHATCTSRSSSSTRARAPLRARRPARSRHHARGRSCALPRQSSCARRPPTRSRSARAR
jgi:acyl-CoA reductase-like NAD-dependent aldehyde dehydrogenase